MLAPAQSFIYRHKVTQLTQEAKAKKQKLHRRPHSSIEEQSKEYKYSKNCCLTEAKEYIDNQ
jgi:hypothetical protein